MGDYKFRVHGCFWFLDTIIISYIIGIALDRDMGFLNTFTINMIGRYYSSLIPLGGGQAAQICICLNGVFLRYL